MPKQASSIESLPDHFVVKSPVRSRSQLFDLSLAPFRPAGSSAKIGPPPLLTRRRWCEPNGGEERWNGAGGALARSILFRNSQRSGLSDVCALENLAMLLLPIVDRELRVAARDSRTYLGRLMVGLAALAMALYLIWFSHLVVGAGLAGMFILKAAAYLAWAICLFGALTRTSDAISSEKRSDTLGLLFLTELKGYDIVLGKLVAGSLSTFYSLIGIVPILSIPVMLGGVSGVEIFRIPLVLLVSIFLASCLGLLASSLVQSRRAAWGIASAMVLLLVLLLPIAAQVADRYYVQPELARLLRIPSPAGALEMAFSPGFGPAKNDFWLALACEAALALVALVASCLITPRSWKVAARPKDRIVRWLKRWLYGSASQRALRRTRLLAKNPLLWLHCRDRFAPLWPSLVVVGTLSLIAWIVNHYGLPPEPALVLMIVFIAINDVIIGLRVANIGSVRLAEDRQSGALETILGTPITTREIVQGTWMAIRKIQLPAYCLLFLAYAIISSLIFYRDDPTLEEAAATLVFAMVSMGDFFVLGYVAIWTGVKVHNPRHAAGSSVFRVVLVPWAIWLGLMPVMLNTMNSTSYFLLGLSIWMGSAIHALRSTRRNLKNHFREAATDRAVFEEKFNPWRRLARRRENPIPYPYSREACS